MGLIVHDFDVINIERPQMVAKLIVTLERSMQKGLLHNQLNGVAACANKYLIWLDYPLTLNTTTKTAGVANGSSIIISSPRIEVSLRFKWSCL